MRITLFGRGFLFDKYGPRVGGGVEMGSEV